MVKLQFDIPQDLSDKLKIYKVQNKIKTQAESIIQILTKYFETQNVSPISTTV